MHVLFMYAVVKSLGYYEVFWAELTDDFTLTNDARLPPALGLKSEAATA